MSGLKAHEFRRWLANHGRGRPHVMACALLLASACSGSMPSSGTASEDLPAPAALSPSADEVARGAVSVGARTRTDNPFAGARFYVDPGYTRDADATAARFPALASAFEKAGAVPTAIWIDAIAHLSRVTTALDDAAAQQARGGAPVVSVFVVYDMPNRDCSARASAGELSIDRGGEARYRSELIDPIAQAFAAHPGQRVAVILEPDSLANLATNLGLPKCAASDAVYRRSTAYAISKLSMPNVAVYLDAGHAGWLGWAANRSKIAAVYKDVLTAAGGVDKIRGFFTNVSNYNVLRGDDGRRMERSTPCPDELTYVDKLAETLAHEGITGEGFVVDTGRNGRGGIRSQWGHWCNVKGAGLGERPRASPAPLVDAYYWVKTPGYSDGSSDPADARFDAMCGSADAATGAPEAGVWFPSYFAELVRNANPPL